MERAGYLGPQGSYSYLAAQEVFPDGEKIVYPSFRAIFSALSRGEITAAVVPIKNTVNGAVTQNLDLLEEGEDLLAVGEIKIALDHRLATFKGAKLEDIERVYSHPQALEQCSKFLSKHLPAARTVAAASTADGLKMIDGPKSAAIVGAHVKAEGLCLSKETISDEKENYTHFLKVVKGASACGVEGRRYLFCFTLKHEAGSLCNALKVLADHGVNMTEIESRPIKGKTGEFRFFAEIECNKEVAQAALKALSNETLSLKLLGKY